MVFSLVSSDGKKMPTVLIDQGNKIITDVYQHSRRSWEAMDWGELLYWWKYHYPTEWSTHSYCKEYPGVAQGKFAEIPEQDRLAPSSPDLNSLEY